MNSRRMYFVMIGVFVLLVVSLVGVMFMGNKLLKQRSQALLAAKLDQQSLNEQQAALVQAKQDLKDYSQLYDIARTVVPQDKDQAKAVREIVRLADESGVRLGSVVFDDSTLGQAKSNSSSSQPTSSVTQAKPVEGLPGVYSIPVVITSTKGDNQFNNFLTFLDKIEHNRRTAQVASVTINPGQSKDGGNYIDFTLIVNIYVKP